MPQHSFGFATVWPHPSRSQPAEVSISSRTNATSCDLLFRRSRGGAEFRGPRRRLGILIIPPTGVINEFSVRASVHLGGVRTYIWIFRYTLWRTTGCLFRCTFWRTSGSLDRRQAIKVWAMLPLPPCLQMSVFDECLDGQGYALPLEAPNSSARCSCTSNPSCCSWHRDTATAGSRSRAACGGSARLAATWLKTRNLREANSCLERGPCAGPGFGVTLAMVTLAFLDGLPGPLWFKSICKTSGRQLQQLAA